MNLTKQVFLSAAIAAAAMLTGQPASAQPYPNHPITVIIPFAGGSASDVVSRIMFDKMSRSMGQPIVIENRPGAGGNIGTAAAAKATPDGYTLVGSGSGPFAANKALYKDLGYDPETDFEVIAPFAFFNIVVVVSTKLPVKTLAELIAYAKANPGKLNYGSVGIGSSQHLGGEYFQQIAGVQITHVPYRNIAQYGPDLIAGQVPLGFQWLPNVIAPIRAGGAKAVAVAAKTRLPALPDVPTTIEAGLPDYQASGWFAMAAPKDTPKEIVARLNREMAKAIADPEVKEKFQQQGAEGRVPSVAESIKFVHDEIIKWDGIITKAGIPKID
jgi:tripartite-type tricarboxylate transporter receptor subunit TctC